MSLMGELLGPKPDTEIVITLYDDAEKTLNFQFEGFGKHADPETVYKMLALVAQQLHPNLVTPTPPQETPHE